MSNSNVFTNNLMQTTLNDAYQFETFSDFIKKQAKVRFSSLCVFCSSKNTISLTNDGSFKQCTNCKKQFKALLLNKFHN